MAYLRLKKKIVQMPVDAVIVLRAGEEWAEWKGPNGLVRRGPIVRSPDGQVKVEQQGVRCWCIRGQDQDGRSYEISTGCKDRKNALQKLALHEAVKEKVRSGLMSREESAALAWVNVPLSKHLADYCAWQTARGFLKNTVNTKNAYLTEMCRDLRWRTARDLSRSSAEAWALRRKQARNSAPRTYNMIVAAGHAFGAWMKNEGRILHNPFDGWHKLNERVDMRRERRAMMPEELEAFLQAAEERPRAQRLLAWPTMNEAAQERYREVGRERALVYRSLLTTGLRWGELRSITIAQTHLEADPPYLLLEAKNEKNRQGSNIPIRADVAAAIVAHVDKKRENRPHCMSDAEWMASPLFDMTPSGLRILNKDLEWAKLAKRDANGRVLDVHALRHTFGTMLAKEGLSLVIVQKAMRHSSPELTANVYTHIGVGDILKACETLPSITPKSVLVGIEGVNAPDNNTKEGNPSDVPHSEPQAITGMMDRRSLEAMSREELLEFITHNLVRRCNN